jgi:hypothetical protein
METTGAMSIPVIGSGLMKVFETIEPASEFQSEATLSAQALRRFDLIVAHR